MPLLLRVIVFCVTGAPEAKQFNQEPGTQEGTFARGGNSSEAFSMRSETFPAYSGPIRYLDERKQCGNFESFLGSALRNHKGNAK